MANSRIALLSLHWANIVLRPRNAAIFRIVRPLDVSAIIASALSLSEAVTADLDKYADVSVLNTYTGPYHKDFSVSLHRSSNRKLLPQSWFSFSCS